MSETPQQAAHRLAQAVITNGYRPEALHPYTNEMGVARLDLPAKGDCVDWLARHPQATAAEVRALDCAPTRGAETTSTTAPPAQRPGTTSTTPPLVQPPSATSTTEAIARLVSLKPFEYALARRAEAKKLGVSVKALDDEVARVKRESEEEEAFEFIPTVVPTEEPVDPAQLLADIRKAILTFMICDPETAVAATLWVAFTWFIDQVPVAPIAVITSPEKRCGKTLFLTLIKWMSLRPLLSANITGPAVFRTVEAFKPTLLIDDADTFLKNDEQLRGILNSGHTREAAFSLRTSGDDHVPRVFRTWSAKCLAGIGKVADTLMDRAVVLNLRRKLSEEEAVRIRDVEPGLFEGLASRLARFGLDAAEAIEKARPHLPRELNDRAQDNWEPLFAIADHAGGEWPALARRAAIKICGAESTTSVGVELLTDVREILAERTQERIASADLLRKLTSNEEKRWATFRDGKPMTIYQLSAQLKSSEYVLMSSASTARPLAGIAPPTLPRPSPATSSRQPHRARTSRPVTTCQIAP